MHHSSPSSTAIARYLRGLQLRLALVYAARGVALSCALACVLLLGAAPFCDTIVTQATAHGLWLAAGLVALAVLGVCARAAASHSGVRAARLFDTLDPQLGSRVRSAIELTRASEDASSPELVQAHLAGVQRELEALPLQRVVAWRRLGHWSVWAALLLVIASATVTLREPRLRIFVHGLVAPARVRADGTRVAKVLRHVSVRLSYPSYLAREGATLRDPALIVAPRGTTLQLQVEALLPAQRGVLRIDNQRVVLSVADDGTLRGRFSAQHSAQLHVQLESGGVRYEDPLAMALQVVTDKTPRVVIDSPQAQALVRPDEVVPLRFTASDDLGVASVELHMRLPDGSEKEHSVWSSADDAGPKAELRASTDLVPSELGLHAGDSLVVWLSVRDEDLVSGPNVGKSQELHIDVASQQRRMSAFIPDLQTVADAAVDLLGDRLSDDAPQQAAPALLRFSRIEHLTRAWLVMLDKLTSAAARAEPRGNLDYDKLAAVKRRNQKLIDEEATLHRSVVASFATRARSDARNVDELERDVVLITDLLAKAHVDEAGAIATELRQLKKRIEDLMAKLGKNPSPEDERALLAEIERAKQRLAELAQSLSRMATRVPGEFMNEEALKQEPQAGQTLQDLESAVKRHDLHGAAESLDALAKQIDKLASQISEGGVRMRQSRFGPQDQAMAAARQKLDLLAQEQSRLLQHSRDIEQSGGQRGDPSRNAGNKQMAQSLSDLLNQMQNGPSAQSPSMQRARDRMHDAQDAMRADDLAAARAAAQSARQALQQAAAEMGAQAQMYQGRNPQATRDAEQAQHAASDAQRLEDALNAGQQPGSGPVSERDRQKLRADVDPQHKTRQAAEQLKDAFERGPDGLPLSPDATQRLQDAQKAMEHAEQALQQGQPGQAAQAQQAAADGLHKLSEKLAQQQRGEDSPGQGEPGSASAGATSQAPVHIPDAQDFKGPAQMRRRLLDAMREAAPTGFEAAVQRYYQELLR